MKTLGQRLLSYFALVLILSGCAQSRMGMGGFYETAYQLPVQPICRGSQTNACFELTVNFNDTQGSLYVKWARAWVANTNVRVLGYTNQYGWEVLHTGFKPAPGNAIQLREGRAKLYEYTRWQVETTTSGHMGPDLVPQSVPPGQGMLIAEDTTVYTQKMLDEIYAAYYGYNQQNFANQNYY